MHICHICRHEVRQVHASFLSDYPEKIAQTCKAIPHISSPCLGFFSRFFCHEACILFDCPIELTQAIPEIT